LFCFKSAIFSFGNNRGLLRVTPEVLVDNAMPDLPNCSIEDQKGS